jgi:hypothetical protein
VKQKKWAGALREVSAIRRRREFKVSRGVPAASGQSNRVGRRLPKGISPQTIVASNGESGVSALVLPNQGEFDGKEVDLLSIYLISERGNKNS